MVSSIPNVNHLFAHSEMISSIGLENFQFKEQWSFDLNLLALIVLLAHS